MGEGNMSYLICRTCSSFVRASDLEQHQDGFKCHQPGCGGMHFDKLSEILADGECPRCSRNRIRESEKQCGYCRWPQNNDGSWSELAKEVVLNG